MAREYETRTRMVRKGETIDYDCGCIYIVEQTEDGIPTKVRVDFWCSEHDPTLWGNSPACKEVA